MSGKFDEKYVIESNIENDYILWEEISYDVLSDLEDLIGSTFIDHLTQQNPVTIKVVPAYALRKSKIEGLIADGYSEEDAISMVDDPTGEKQLEIKTNQVN